MRYAIEFWFCKNQFQTLTFHIALWCDVTNTKTCDCRRERTSANNGPSQMQRNQKIARCNFTEFWFDKNPIQTTSFNAVRRAHNRDSVPIIGCQKDRERKMNRGSKSRGDLTGTKAPRVHNSSGHRGGLFLATASTKRASARTAPRLSATIV